ncbi:hypothetical protein J3L11_09935 [Shewanella sp. 4t3-1-2LB]|uniref:hypothetical protein n=1 Tax=Shewanella sp. 4t3-1-2LB TaxID=2817682 RepID=UPI001A9825E6|nr:hypothetical protein [Shewanella sp. 4t3-1-2LB]MBO1271959.1 hypothetical protein [Shewanella sp. 4t3-1-2LB]
MKKEARLIRMYGANEAGLAMLPTKVSGTQISRSCVGEEMGCTHCFPHGIDTSNSHDMKLQRCWKKYRKHQWRS